MDSVNSSKEAGKTALMKTETAAEAPAQVFQPQKLTEIVSMIDLMGSISERMGEDRSGDMGGAGGTSGASAAGQGQQSGASARDQAIANIPMPVVMQKELISHIETEMKALNRQARTLSKSNAKGAAFMLSELYKKIRHLSGMIDKLLEASAELIRRFYIAVFIDKQSVVSGAAALGQSGK